MSPNHARRSHSIALRRVSLVPVVLVAIMLPPAAEAATWINANGGNWTVASNWSPANVPNAAGETAVFPDLGRPYTVTLNTGSAGPCGCELRIDSVDISGTNVTLDLSYRTIVTLQPAGFRNRGRVVGGYGVSGIRGNVRNEAGAIIEALGPFPSLNVGLFGPLVVNDGIIRASGGARIDLGSTTTSATLSGSGTVVLNNGTLEVHSTTTAPSVNAGQTISGWGGIAVFAVNSPAQTGPVFRNEGLIEAQGGLLRVYNNGLMVNTGTIRSSAPLTNQLRLDIDMINTGLISSNGGKLILSAAYDWQTIDNTGGVIRADGTDVDIYGGRAAYPGLTHLKIAGGTLEQTGGARFTMDNLVLFENLTLNADLLGFHSSRSQPGYNDITGLYVQGSLINNGNIDTGGHLRVIVDAPNGAVNPRGPGTIGGSGRLLLRNVPNPAISSGGGMVLTNGPGHTIEGTTGTININAPLVNEGILAPTLTPNRININNSYTQSASGALRVSVGAAANSRLNVTGPTLMAGTLQVDPISGYVLPLGSPRIVMTYLA